MVSASNNGEHLLPIETHTPSLQDPPKRMEESLQPGVTRARWAVLVLLVSGALFTFVALSQKGSQGAQFDCLAIGFPTGFASRLG